MEDEAEGATEPDNDQQLPLGDELGLGGSLGAAILLALVSFLVVNWATNTAGPFGPTSVEDGVVVEVDRSTVTGGGGNSNSQRYLTFIETADGSVERFDNVKISAYAEVGDTVLVERSNWSHRLVAVEVDEGRFGQAEDVGWVFRVGFLLVLGIVAAGVLVLIFGIVTTEFPAGLVVIPIVAAGAWLGLQWALA